MVYAARKDKRKILKIIVKDITLIWDMFRPKREVKIQTEYCISHRFHPLKKKEQDKRQ